MELSLDVIKSMQRTTEKLQEWLKPKPDERILTRHKYTGAKKNIALSLDEPLEESGKILDELRLCGRINRFNVGKDPIKMLDQRIRRLIGKDHKGNNLLDDILGTVEGLQNGHMKECPKCKVVRNLDDFRDSSLITGYGRFCRGCKGLTEFKKPGTTTAVKDTGTKAQRCPKCGSRMVLRNGRYGAFYGCSKYPYCRGTRNC